MKKTAAMIAVLLAAMFLHAEVRLGTRSMKDVVVLEPVDKTNMLAAITSGDTAALAALIASNALARAAIVAEAGERVAGDTAARTNHVAAVAAEALLRAQGDAASIAAFATNRVTRLDGTSNSWQTVENGISYIYAETPDTNRVRIVSTSPNFNGPSVGTVLQWNSGEQLFGNSDNIFALFSGEGFIISLYDLRGGVDRMWERIADETYFLPQTVLPSLNAVGSCVIDYGTRTNRTAQAAEPTILIIADQVEANTAAIAAIPLPPTNILNSFVVWDSGSNRYWRVTATNLRFYVWGDL